MTKEVIDLRSALELLESIPGQMVHTDVEVDPSAELAGVYRYVGAGGTVARPTKTGPAMTFENVKGHPGAKVVIGLLASRKRVGYLLNSKPEKLGFMMRDAVKNAIAPVVVDKAKAQCQEVVHLATDEGFDIRKLIPAPTNTPEDAGPYVTLGMCYASDVETGESDVTIHRLCLQSKDEISMFFTPGARHLGAFREKAEALSKPLPISISIGVDPAIEIASCFEPPTTPLGFNELSIAGAIRGKAVELAPCVTIDENCIANAEYVIEGELLVGARVRDVPAFGGGSCVINIVFDKPGFRPVLISPRLCLLLTFERIRLSMAKDFTPSSRNREAFEAMTDTVGNVPPQAVELEEAVLGALMLEKDCIITVPRRLFVRVQF